jgi:hypothetical protein
MVFKWLKNVVGPLKKKKMTGQEFQHEIDVLRAHMLLVYRGLADKESVSPEQIVRDGLQIYSCTCLSAMLNIENLFDLLYSSRNDLHL